LFAHNTYFRRLNDTPAKPANPNPNSVIVAGSGIAGPGPVPVDVITVGVGIGVGVGVMPKGALPCAATGATVGSNITTAAKTIATTATRAIVFNIDFESSILFSNLW